MKKIKLKINKTKELRRASRQVIGRPSRGRKVGAHIDRAKELNKKNCRTKEEEE